MNANRTTLFYTTDRDQSRQGDLFLPKTITGQTRKILLIHGGAWSSMDRDSAAGVAEFFREQGFIVFNIEYRLTTAAPWPACGDDCLEAAKFLFNADLEGQKPLIICGLSAGGHLALMTGLRLPAEMVSGIISISGIADPEPDRQIHPERYEKLFGGKNFDATAFPGAWLTPQAPPMLLTHQYNDTVVPLAASSNFARRATALGCNIRTYYYDMERKALHHEIWLPGSDPKRLYPDIEQACLEFIRQCAGEPEPLANENGMQFQGKLRHRTSSEVKDSIISIGFECLDRDMFDPEFCYNQLAASGVKWARVQTGWWKCEKVKGQYDFAWIDDIVDNLMRRGLKPWFNVGYGNKLYMENTFGEASVGFVPLYYGDECLEAWKKYCRALAEHYRGKIKRFEIWNEANISSFWQPKGSNAEDYAKLIDLTGQEIRQVIPEAEIGGCVSGYNSPYILDFAQTGILPKINFFSLHPYIPHPEYGWRKTVEHLRRYFAANGGAKVAIWQGESGFASWCPEKYWQPRFVRESERNQAVWLLRRYLLDHACGIPLSSYFQMADMMKKSYAMSNSAQSSFTTARQGILNGLTYTPKKAYSAMANLASIFRDGIRPAEAGFEVSFEAVTPRLERADRIQDIAIWTQCFVRDGKPFYAYYMPADPQYNWKALDKIILKIYPENDFEPLARPVLVNLLTGDIFEPHRQWEGDIMVFNGMPLTDSPLLLCDYSTLEIN